MLGICIGPSCTVRKGESGSETFFRASSYTIWDECSVGRLSRAVTDHQTVWDDSLRFTATTTTKKWSVWFVFRPGNTSVYWKHSSSRAAGPWETRSTVWAFRKGAVAAVCRTDSSRLYQWLETKQQKGAFTEWYDHPANEKWHLFSQHDPWQTWKTFKRQNKSHLLVRACVFGSELFTWLSLQATCSGSEYWFTWRESIEKYKQTSLNLTGECVHVLVFIIICTITYTYVSEGHTRDQ